MSSDKFPAFPYTPYNIQLDFMTALYNALDKGGVAIFESPTGTGKTLSLICSSFQWLVNQKSKTQVPVVTGTCLKNDNDDDEPDWMRDFEVQKETPMRKSERVKRYSGKKPSMASKFFLGNEEASDGMAKRPKAASGSLCQGGFDDDSEYLIEDYESGDDGDDRDPKKAKTSHIGLDSSSSEENEDEDSDSESANEEPLKIYYCSRTHSQLSQFVKELRRTRFAGDVRVACLGSRKTFCINSDVIMLASRDRINDRCLELQKNQTLKTSSSKVEKKGKMSSRCPMLRRKKLRQFKELSQQEILDVEDLVSLGQKIGACPYYGSRSLIPSASVVVLPYQSLLLKSARESLGINLKDAIVIIDEAHNLVDTVTDMHNSNISISQLQLVSCHLKGYMEKFRNRLGSGSRRYIQMLLILIQAFLQSLSNQGDTKIQMRKKGATDDVVMTINEFLFLLDIDNINLIKLECFIRESNIIHKVNGYGEKYLSEMSDFQSLNAASFHVGSQSSTLSAFRAIVSFLHALTHEQSDGRVIISKTTTSSLDEQREGYLKFVMLDAEKTFADIVGEAHSVVLAGGTLQPVEEMRERLFPRVPEDKIHVFSCGHIVPAENILPIVVSHGPTGQMFNFTYDSRSSPSMIGELGRLIGNIASVVPEGIVVFFASFEYENQVYAIWKETGILQMLEKKKRVFREPRNNAAVEAILNDYKATVMIPKSATENRVRNGAILLAVVGGKVSEGINFSDGMGRCVIMVGLPYPNLSNPELVERIKHIDKLGETLTHPKIKDENVWRSRSDVLRCCSNRGREYYENLCMKAVNQSIGRAIRHIGDYAAILLVDARYASTQDCNSFHGSLSKPSSKLPMWIKERLVTKGNFGAVQKLLSDFFKYQRNKLQTNLDYVLK